MIQKIMLQNNLFKFTPLLINNDIIRTDIEINAAHPIFKGHFPGQPVLPGACILQMLKEITEHYLGKPTRLKKASDLKFLSVIVSDPQRTIQMELKISVADNDIKVEAQLLDDAAILFKFKGTFGITRIMSCQL